MPYKIVFRNENNGFGEEVTIPANDARFDEKSGVMELLDKNRVIIAYIPLERVLYIQRTDGSA